MTPKNAIRLARQTLAEAYALDLDERTKKMRGHGPVSNEIAEAYNLLADLNIDDLLEDADVLTCLRNAGVDNWEGWDFAMEEFHAGRDD